MTEPDIYDLAAQQAEQSVPEQEEPEPRYTYAQLKTEAYNGTFPDEKLPMPDRILWWALRDMYARFKSGKVTKEQGEAERIAAENLYRKDRLKYEEYKSNLKRIASFWNEIEAAATEYAKSPNRTTEADKFFEAVYKAIPKG